MRHAYFMAPLEPSRTQRRARTMCGQEVAPRYIAFPDDTTITCPTCKAKTIDVRHAYNTMRPETDQTREEVNRALHRLNAIIGGTA